MKLTRVHVIKAATCGGLLDGLDVGLRGALTGPEQFDPLCLVGPNGAGKSQFLQVIAEAFQTIFHTCVGDEEPAKGNEELQFEIEYVIQPARARQPILVRASRRADGKRRPTLKIERKHGSEWIECPLETPETHAMLPSRVIGYTSGDNETLSLPFLVSRSGYAEAVRDQAFERGPQATQKPIPETRLMLVDYGTHLEVLVANLVLGSIAERNALLRDAKVTKLHSFRCVIQLAHSAITKVSRKSSTRKRKGVQLTDELETFIDQLRRCSTCHSYEEKSETYVFDFLMSDENRAAFHCFWKTSIDLYSALHKLAMLNDLAIRKTTRERLLHDIKTRRFASRLSEPQEEDRVFRFEQVCFVPLAGSGVVDYVSLSDGEHQLAQILGTMCMASFPNALFLLDEPESHFNPQWRVRFISRLMDLPTANGRRRDAGGASAQQDCLLTTHAPFVPSDMSRDKVLIFAKSETGVDVRRPGIETFGTTFDTILEECFDVRPPMSEVPRREIADLMQSQNRAEIKAGIARLGDSVEKVFLMDRLRELLEGA